MKPWLVLERAASNPAHYVVYSTYEKKEDALAAIKLQLKPDCDGYCQPLGTEYILMFRNAQDHFYVEEFWRIETALASYDSGGLGRLPYVGRLGSL